MLIAYFLGNIYAKNCRNRTVYVKIIASCKGGTFLKHSVDSWTLHVPALASSWDADKTGWIEHCYCWKARRQ